MPTFAYRALTATQQSAAGTLTADTPAQARMSLRARGYWVTELAPMNNGARGWVSLRRRGQQAAIAELWRNLALLLQAGVPLTDAVSICRRQRGGPLGAMLDEIIEEIRGGRSLTEALVGHPRWFDELARAMLGVGEQSGDLATACGELATYLERAQSTANRLATALIYPAILTLVGIGVAGFLMTYVVPQLIEVLVSAGRELPWPTRVLQVLTNVLTAWFWPILIVVGGILAGLGALYRTSTGRRGFERGLLRIPVVGDLVRKSGVARFSMMLAALLRADVRFTTAVSIVRKSLPPGLLAAELQRLETAVEEGAAIRKPLEGSVVIPPLVTHLLHVGQESGELSQMLDQVRGSYEDELRIATQRFLAVLEPTLIVILALVIGFIVFATVLPILESTRIVQ